MTETAPLAEVIAGVFLYCTGLGLSIIGQQIPASVCFLGIALLAVSRTYYKTHSYK